MAKYACKQCGAELFFDPKVGKLHCEYCDSIFDPSEFDFTPEQDQEKAAAKDRTIDQNHTEEEIAAAKARGMSEAQAEAAADGSQSTDDSQGDLVMYSCPNCGAEIITAKETAVTTCVYCNKAITLEGNLAGVFKPDFVLPFVKTKEDVEAAYYKLCKSSILTPPRFLNKDNIKKIKGMYIPFWLYSFRGDSHLRVRAENVRTWVQGDMEYTETSRYSIQEDLRADFSKIPVDALKKMDNDMMDSIEPFDMSSLQPFNPAYLAGFYTQRWDDSALDNESRAKSRARTSMLREGVRRAGSYTHTSIESESYEWSDSVTQSAMIPIWMMYTEYKGKNYIFGMNGQTGKLMGKIPKSLGRLFGIGAGVFAAAEIIMMIIRIAEVLV